MKSEQNPTINLFLLVLGICLIFLILYFAKFHLIGFLGGKAINVNEITPSPVSTPAVQTQFPTP